jgi:predicted small integral membrane protein
MTVWEIKSPTTMRKGFLPIATTRGDRLFIGLLSGGLAEPGLRGREREDDRLVRLEQEPSIWFSFVASMALLALVMRKG